MSKSQQEQIYDWYKILEPLFGPNNSFEGPYVNNNVNNNVKNPPFGKQVDANPTVRNKEYHSIITFDLVGVKKEDIDLSIEDGYLLLKAVRYQDNKAIKNYNLRFPFPLELNTSPENTSYKDGVLSLCFKKKDKNSTKITL